MTKRLEAAFVVELPVEPSEKVLFGAWVEVLNEEGVTRNFRIVGIDETNATIGWVSWTSPLGKALLGAGLGDAVTVKTPKGEQEYEVVSVSYSEPSLGKRAK